MAKKFYELFQGSAETQYASMITPLLTLSKINKVGARMNIVSIQGHGSDNTNPQVAIQRTKRLKASDSLLTSGPNKAGTDYVARLDKAQKVDWTTVEMKATVKRDLLIEIPLNTQFDINGSDATPFTNTIAQITNNKFIELEEIYENALWTGASGTGASSAVEKLTWDGTATQAQALAKKIIDVAESIQLFVDEFKAYSRSVIVLIHPTLARAFSDVQGISYSLGTNTFGNAYTQGFTYKEISFYTSPILNSIQGAAATEVAGAIIFDAESFLCAGPDFNAVPIQDKLLDVQVIGHTYSQISAIVDPLRMKKFEFTLPSTLEISKKVNA